MNYTKAQGQVAGSDGEFGTIYSLKDGWNYEILSARYSVAPFLCYAGAMPGQNEKVLVFGIAIKNASPSNTFSDYATVFDSQGQQYTTGVESIALASKGSQDMETDLKPGQGSVSRV